MKIEKKQQLLCQKHLRNSGNHVYVCTRKSVKTAEYEIIHLYIYTHTIKVFYLITITLLLKLSNISCGVQFWKNPTNISNKNKFIMQIP